MFKKLLVPVLLVGGTILGMLLLSAALQPSKFVVARSATMNAPPAKVFEQVNDFHNWNAWSPWAKLDPHAKNKFDGPPAGKGAKFAWFDSAKLGEGNMTITESKPNELVELDLVFVKPFSASCETAFKFEPEGNGTKVTWTMSGENGFLGRVMCLVMNMDKMQGGMFEQGLANMKAIVEPPSKPAAEHLSK